MTATNMRSNFGAPWAVDHSKSIVLFNAHSHIFAYELFLAPTLETT